MFTILISNDDGCLAPGLLALKEAVSEIAKVIVIAPESDLSGSSSSLTLKNPLRIHRLDENYYSLAGTPADCVHAALSGLIDIKPDLVITGINNRSNLGDDIIYSGTFSAAYEGRNLPYPSISLSMASSVASPNYETGTKVCLYLIDKIMKKNFRRSTVLNVNIPDEDYQNIKGYKVTRLGKRQPSNLIEKGIDPRGHEYFWLGARGEPVNPDDEQTDFYAIRHGYVSITPIAFDLVDEKVLNDLQFFL